MYLDAGSTKYDAFRDPFDAFPIKQRMPDPPIQQSEYHAKSFQRLAHGGYLGRLIFPCAVVIEETGTHWCISPGQDFALRRSTGVPG